MAGTLLGGEKTVNHRVTLIIPLLMIWLAIMLLLLYEVDDIALPSFHPAEVSETGTVIASPYIDHERTLAEKHPLKPWHKIADEAEEEFYEDELCPYKPHFNRLAAPAWYIWGRVDDWEGEPIPGARVEFSVIYNDFEDCYFLDPVFTDHQGVYRISAPFPPPLKRMSMTGSFIENITGIAYANGYLPCEEILDHSYALHEAQEDIQIDFCCHSDGVLFGRVVDALGAPVKGADLIVTMMYSGWCETYAMEHRTNGDGYYFNDLWDESLRRFWISACTAGRGVSRLLLVDVDSLEGNRIPDLRLETGGFIAGRALLPTGEPLANIHVHAYPMEKMEISSGSLERHTFIDEGLPPVDVRLKNPFLPSGATRSGKDGRFLIKGLREGEYFIRASGYLYEGQEDWSSGSYKDDTIRFDYDFYPEIQDSRIPCRTGDTNVDLVLGLYTLEVTVCDRWGNLIPSTYMTFESMGCKESARFGGGVFRKQIKPGDYRLWARQNDVDYDRMYIDGELNLFIPRGKYLTRARIVLDEVTKGRVLLKITDSNGDPVADHPEITLCLMGKKAHFWDSLDDLELTNSGTYIKELPPCFYTLDIMPRGHNRYIPPQRHPAPSMLKYLEVEDIEILPGRETYVEAALKIGGRICLTLHDSSGTLDKSDLDNSVRDPKKRKPSFPFRFHDPFRQHKKLSPWLNVTLTSDERGDETKLINFRSKVDGKCSSRCKLEAGVPRVADRIILPGEYMLQVAPEGFEPVTKRITIEPDRITDVVLKLNRTKVDVRSK